MNKELILHRMDKSIAMLKQLTEDKFNLFTWVEKEEHGCPSVACIAGWYSVYQLEVGLKFIKDLEGQIGLGTEDDTEVLPTSMIFHILSEWHGFDYNLTIFLFSGSRSSSWFLASIGRDYSFSIVSPLNVVLQVWEHVRELINNSDEQILLHLNLTE